MALTTSNQAKPTKKQHTRPCGDCPWRRDSIPGWLGPLNADEWLRYAQSDQQILCHTKIGPQCVGSAVFRANICKSPRDPSVIRAAANKQNVFSWPDEFRLHHEKGM